jgi:biotin synthase
MALKDSGLYRYHHNLETARSFYPSVCTTHAYDEDIETVRIAKGAGPPVCCGGIIGIGETMKQRIKPATTLKGTKDIEVCGDKEVNLPQSLSLGIVAGCNSLMTGDYLTTPGRSPALDLEMIADLGLKPLSDSMVATGTKEA